MLKILYSWPGIVIATVALGCSFSAPDLDGMNPGGGPNPPVTVNCEDWNATHFDPCAIASPSDALTLDASGVYLLDTGARTLRDPEGNAIAASVEVETGAPEFVVVSIAGLTIAEAATLRAEGARPAVLAVWGDIRVDGSIDVSSGLTDRPGAGANPSLCNASIDGQEGEDGGGGGGGGGFRGAGGKGGDGGTGELPRGDGGGGGRGVDAPTALRGGCPGAAGGRGDGDVDGSGGGGSGGGAIHLSAFRSMAISGEITAAGAGGAGAQGSIGEDEASKDSGGGGGGSGGLIDLEAPRISLASDAIIASNGGAGGAGCSNDAAESGDHGLLGTARARGGQGDGGDGGDGGSESDNNGREGQNNGEGRRRRRAAASATSCFARPTCSRTRRPPCRPDPSRNRSGRRSGEVASAHPRRRMRTAGSPTMT